VTWILLRGLAREARHWGSFAQQFSEVLATSNLIHQVEALDLPGNGEFCQLPSPTSVPHMVEFSRQQLQRKGFKPPYSLVALSLGGMVATRWAQQYPREITRLVLINTSMRPFSSITERLRPGNWLKLALLIARWGDTAYAERSIYRLTCNQTNNYHHDLAVWRGIRQDASVSATSALRQLWAAARFSSDVTPLLCNCLVLSSAGDQLVNPVCSARLANAYNAQHNQHSWAGHDLPHDDADWVYQQITSWLLN